MDMKKEQEFEVFEFPIMEEFENVKLPNPEAMTYWKNYKERIIYLDTMITADTTMQIIQSIFEFNGEDKGKAVEDRKPIRIVCFSYGGDTSIGEAVIDAFNLSKTPIWVLATGICASMSALIFMAGHKRYVTPRAQLLIHQGEMKMEGQTTQMIETMKNYEKSEQKIKTYVLEKTNIAEALYDQKYKTEWYLDANEMVELGVAQEILKDMDLFC